MSLSPLKFSFGISVLVHGLVISGAVWLGQFHRAPASVAMGNRPTLELIAAPANAPVAAILTPPIATPPAPMAAPPSTPPEEIISEPVPELLKTEATILPPPAAPIQPTVEPQEMIQVVRPAPAATASRPTTQPGDGSAPTPGADFTTVAGRPSVPAKPDYLKNPKPKYPPVAERRYQQGTVVLNVTVSASGRAMKIAVKKSSGFELLDQAAITAVREWEFTPARIGSLAVESEIEVPWRFTLKN